MSCVVIRLNMGRLKGEGTSINGGTGVGLLSSVPVANFMAETHQARRMVTVSVKGSPIDDEKKPGDKTQLFTPASA